MPLSSRVPAAFAATMLGLSLAGCSGGGSGGAVASVNGEDISRSAYDAKVYANPAAKSALNQLVQADLIDQYARDNHVDVADADISKKEDDIKSKYPPGQFEQILKAQNLTEDDVRKIIKEQLVVQKAVSGNVHVTDSDVSSYLAKNHATLDTPAQAHARHILVADLKTAQIVEGKLKSGGDFAALAKQYSTDPSTKDKGGDLGFFGKGQMVPSFQAAAFSQPLHVVGAPVKSPFGYHVIEVLERKPALVATAANADKKIRDTLQQQQEQQQIPQFLAQLRSKANIQINEPALKDALPPIPAAAPSGAAAAPSGAAPAPKPAAS